MENQKLNELRRKQLGKRVADQKDLCEFADSLSEVILALRAGYGLPDMYAHAFEAESWTGNLDDDVPLIKAVNHYQGSTHNTLFEHVVRVANQFHRQGKDGRVFLALAVAEYLLGYQINLRADLARMEAIAGHGHMAYESPNKGLFDKMERRIAEDAFKLDQALATCDTAEDVVLVLCGRVSERLGQPDKRVRGQLANLQQRARRAGHGTLLFSLQKTEGELDRLQADAKKVNPMDPDAVGALVHRRYGIITRNRGVFGLKDKALQAELNRKPRFEPKKGKKRGPKRKPAQKSAQQEAKAS